MTRNGKIARLPRKLREQINRKIDDGVAGIEIVRWLNSLPEVKALLARLFDGRPIRPQNLSEWKAGGFRDWQIRLEALDAVRDLSEEAEALQQAAGKPLTETLAHWTAARYAVAAGKLAAEGVEGQEQWKRLRGFCHDVVALRRSEQNAQKLIVRQWRLKMAQEIHHATLDDATDVALDQFADLLRKFPNLRGAFNTFRNLVLERVRQEKLAEEARAEASPQAAQNPNTTRVPVDAAA
jgi:hypothetical protein